MTRIFETDIDNRIIKIRMDIITKHEFRYATMRSQDWSQPYDSFEKAYAALREDMGEETDSFP